ncbi:MAG: bacterioferritin [Chromatiales bacterium]|nr:bacterioferritin [Gammaproteobacteria bacterium]MCP5230984.1 bacterioferritin [Zoogloeaceae bacterium]MCP5352292.1 bacterioferritin [Chromatiales bacterium]
MHSDPRILGYLGRALSLELSAVQMYSTQARLCAAWGLDEPARRLREESLEEMQHADRIIGRMVALGVAPNASQLRPAAVGADLMSLLQADYAFELELVQLYYDAATHSARQGLSDDRLFFQTLLEEEQAHARELTTWLAELDRPIGASLDPVLSATVQTSTERAQARISGDADKEGWLNSGQANRRRAQRDLAAQRARNGR